MNASDLQEKIDKLTLRKDRLVAMNTACRKQLEDARMQLAEFEYGKCGESILFIDNDGIEKTGKILRFEPRTYDSKLLCIVEITRYDRAFETHVSSPKLLKKNQV
jgi:hypothetical protein